MSQRQFGVSVVIPAYNAGDFITGALKRLLEQSMSVQIIVVDDASTDGTGKMVADFANRDPRVLLLSHDVNQGAAAARQTGVAAAGGRYIWFVDADDEWAADGAEVMLAAAEHSGSDIVCAAADYVYQDGRRRSVPALAGGVRLRGDEAFREMLLGRLSGHLWNKLFAARLFGDVTFTRSRQHSDQAMVAQLLVAADSVIGIADLVYGYRLRTGSIIRSGSRRAESLDSVAQVVLSCAERVGPETPHSHEFAYYTGRFSLLSRMKDATSGAYTEVETRDLVRRARREMKPAVFASLARERDAKRLALLIAARTNLPVYRLAMRREGARS
ncbi:MAG: glycosyltransferase family 2 protein [Nakamurella sp.]